MEKNAITTILIALILSIAVAGVVSALVSTQFASGPQGPKGDKGDTGATGATGPQGIQGPPGITAINSTIIDTINVTYATPIGNVTITAPANGTVIITLNIGYVDMYNNNSCVIYLGTTPGGNDIDICTQGSRNPGPTNEQIYFDMTAQATLRVTAGNNYTLYATASRYFGGDDAFMALNNIHLIAAMSAI